jgi:hypothetical protein
VSGAWLTEEHWVCERRKKTKRCYCYCGRKRSAAIPFRITRIEFVDATPYKQWAMKVDRKPPITNQQENSHVLKLIEGDASATKPKTSKMLV